jgi:hypothetical protein
VSWPLGGGALAPAFSIVVAKSAVNHSAGDASPRQERLWGKQHISALRISEKMRESRYFSTSGTINQQLINLNQWAGIDQFSNQLTERLPNYY